MATLTCELLRREGEAPFPCVVRTQEGRVLRLHGDAAPKHARWLGMCDGTAVWSEPADAAGPGLGQHLEIDVAELIDEVGVAFGPDGGGGGLFDGPGESSLTGERTGVATEEAGAEQQRTAVLAWIAASLGEPHPLEAQGPPCTALRARIADEPPDLLPSLSTLSAPRDGRVLRPPPPTQPQLQADGDDTVTQVDLLVPAASGAPETTGSGAATTTGGVSRWLTAERVIRVAPWVALALLAISAGAWWVFVVPLYPD